MLRAGGKTSLGAGQGCSLLSCVTEFAIFGMKFEVFMSLFEKGVGIFLLVAFPVLSLVF